MSALISCEPFVPDFPNDAIEAYEPIYATDEDFQITKESGRSIGRAGKIYSYGSVLLINEVNKGIHVIDNADPTNPRIFTSLPFQVTQTWPWRMGWFMPTTCQIWQSFALPRKTLRLLIDWRG
ncbi:MAG: hypothetical protein RJQ14_02015 [Marinoscillum sp.]